MSSTADFFLSFNCTWQCCGSVSFPYGIGSSDPFRGKKARIRPKIKKKLFLLITQKIRVYYSKIKRIRIRNTGTWNKICYEITRTVQDVLSNFHRKFTIEKIYSYSSSGKPKLHIHFHIYVFVSLELKS